jgi:hypothetical protein
MKRSIKKAPSQSEEREMLRKFKRICVIMAAGLFTITVAIGVVSVASAQSG